MTDLLPLYREMAETGTNFSGLSILQHAKQIGALIKLTKSATLLDFGSGRGDAYRSPHKVSHTWGLKRSAVTLYDPSFKGIDVLPNRKFDMVVCSDVLEHVPEVDVDAFIGTLFNYAKLHVWASVCCRPAKKTFPTTGENLHITIQPLDWWREKFVGASELFGPSFTLVETP